MPHFTIVPANEFIHILHIQNTNVKGKSKVMFSLTAIKGIEKRFSNLICKLAEISPDKRVGELKVEILMGIYKSWNGLSISYNEKLISLKVSWLSWTELCGVLGRELRGVFLMELRDGLKLYPNLGDALILYIIFFILIQYPFQNQGFCGLA